MQAAIVTRQPEHQEQHHHHEMPDSGGALTRVALSATLHCLTGCAIGEVLGMVIGTALGFSDLGTVALAVALAFVFGYALTSLPLLRAGMTVAAVIPIALASDTLSIATMEIVDNAIMLAVPGAMQAGIGSTLFWGSLSFALVIAGAVAVPVNRWLIGRGKGHAVVHETGIHGGPSPRVVGIVAALAFVFGSAVLLAEIVDGSQGGGGHGSMAAPAAPAHEEKAGAGHGEEGAAAAPVRGLAASADGLTLELERSELPRGVASTLRFRVAGSDGAAVREFDVEHDRRMHLIVVRRDLSGFQHLHPTMSVDGIWSAGLALPTAGRYRVFADFKHAGRNETLAGDLNVGGSFDPVALPAQTLLHVHPTDSPRADGGRVRFATTFATAGRYRLFLQFNHQASVRTAAFTVGVAR